MTAAADAPAQRLLPAVPKRLDDFEECPRRYWAGNVARPRPATGPRNTASLLGVAAHGALSKVLDPNAGPPTPERAVEHLALAWPEPSADCWRDDAQSGNWYRRFQAWLWRYADTHFDPPPTTLGVERQVAASSTELGIAVEGRVDRVDLRDGEPIVVDYKTGREAPDEHTARSSRTLALYAYGVWRTFRRPCFRVELHHLPTGAVVAAEHTVDTLRRHIERAANVARDIDRATGDLKAGADLDEAFPARPGRLCSYCPFLRSCPPGQAEAPELPPWASLERWEKELPA